MNRTVVLGALLVGALLFSPPFHGWVKQGQRAVADYLDGRPTKTALFVGNSRTFFHDMPYMVRSIADSAGYPEKLHIEMEAKPSTSLATHLENPKTRALIAQKWDHVVLQVLSSEQYSAQTGGQAWEVAAGLIETIKANGAKPAMFVTWRYTDQCKPDAGMPPLAVGLSPQGYANMHVNIQQQHARLAALTGVDLVNVGLVWETLQGLTKDFSLYEDCNHPSIHGSYLSALMFYSYFSGRDVTDVTFRPGGISEKDAQLIRNAVSRYRQEQKPA